MKWQEIPTPCYVVDEKKLKQNLKILQNLEQETGCHVLLAQKVDENFFQTPTPGAFAPAGEMQKVLQILSEKPELVKLLAAM